MATSSSTFDQLVTDLTRDAQRVQPKDALQFCASWFQTRLEEQRARLRDAIAANAFAARDLPLDVYRDTPMGPTGGGSSISSATTTTSYGTVEMGISPLSQVPPPVHVPLRPPSLPPTATVPPPSVAATLGLPTSKKSSLRKSSSYSPFGTLNVPGNALLSDNNNNGIGNSGNNIGNGIFNNNYRMSVSGPSHGSTTSIASTATPVYTPRFVLDGQEIPATSPHDTSNPNPFGSFQWNNNNDDSFGPNHNRVASDDNFLPLPDSSIFLRRKSVSAESIAVDSSTHDPLPVHAKTPEQLRRIKACISNNLIFRDLDEEQETGVLNAMHERKVGQGEVVIRQGDTGDYFYVVESGLLHCFIRPESPAPWQQQQPSRRGTIAGPMLGAAGGAPLLSPATSEPAALAGELIGNNNDEPEEHHPEYGKKVAENKAGTSFGELALMYGHPRAATVVAVEPSTLWSLDRITFRTIILKAAHRRRTMYEQFLSSVTLLSSLEPEERSKVADALVSRVYQDGDAVVRQGEPGDAFFFVEEGEAVVTKATMGPSGETREIEVMRYKKGDYFGELSLLRLAPRAATVSAVIRHDPTQAKLKVAALDASSFTRLLGPLRDLMERHAGRYSMGPRMSLAYDCNNGNVFLGFRITGKNE